MRHALLGFIIAAIPMASGAGPIAQKYGLGWDGTSWGDSIAEVVAKHPGGGHFFAAGGPAQRDYSVPDDGPLFGIARTHMRYYFFFDETDSVYGVSITFPIEERRLLLGLLTSSYGPVRRTETKGIFTTYWWASDDGTTIDLRETLDPNNGILAFEIYGPNSKLSKQEAECVPLHSKNEKK